ncbi:flagellar motor protein MotB [Paremcibacter congregatus]|uniref:flagellar motor protein MotB n=1 Tax=Paremcibacter congregatus TaxID=2043170 RepID=UPI0030EC2DF2|tara:strand:- start:882 stop:1616 length:735 start_codon:yes stop_codon:yes gene_type:complete
MNENIRKAGEISPFEEPEAQPDSTTGLFVSLYLIVLAFFVVMNSISNQEQNKVNAATESVTRAFKNPYEPEADFVDVAAKQDASTPNDEFYAQIQGIFASLVGFEGKFPTKGGHIVKVNFKPSDLFEPDTIEFRALQSAFLQQLATFLKSSRSSEKREIEIVLSAGKTLPRGPRYWEDLNILRAGAFVHALKKKGVPGDQISIGIVKGAEDNVSITFYTRERINVNQNLKDHAIKNGPGAGGDL